MSTKLSFSLLFVALVLILMNVSRVQGRTHWTFHGYVHELRIRPGAVEPVNVLTFGVGKSDTMRKDDKEQPMKKNERVESVARKFVEAINQGDVEAICELMTEDHRFIDSTGEVYDGRERMKKAWIDYYAIIPDYLIDISEALVSGNTVVLIGKASGTYAPDGEIQRENYWVVPAAWRAVVDGDKVKEWQIFADLEAVRKIARRERESEGQ